MRRNFLGGMISVPFANIPQSERHRNKAMSFGDGSLGMLKGSHPVEQSYIDRDYEELEFARKKLRALKELKNAPKRYAYDSSPTHIYCRKATSEAIKNILAGEWRHELALKDAETSVKFLEWKISVPSWVRDFVS